MRPSSADSAVVLLSGGLDSAANLALAARESGDGSAVLALTIRYGQRAAEREVQAARALSGHYGVSHEVIDLPWLGVLGGSALTDPGAAVPTIANDRLDDRALTEQTARAVWVPNRNGVLIHVAAAVAERQGAGRIVVGFNREEAATFPDNSKDYLDCATRALEMSTANHVRVSSYTVDLDKREIVARLRKLSKPFPFELVWSCYHGGPKACGACESCRRYARAIGGS